METKPEFGWSKIVSRFRQEGHVETFFHTYVFYVTSLKVTTFFDLVKAQVWPDKIINQVVGLILCDCPQNRDM